MKNLNELFILIQKNYPMFLTNDVSLCAITGKIVDYVNALIEREKILLEEFKTLKNDANTSVTDLTSAITDFINTENSNYLTFEQEVLDSLVEYKNETDREIEAKSLEVDSSLNNIDLTDEVANYFTSQLNTNYFNNLYNNTKSEAYNLIYYGETPQSDYPFYSYYYNSATDTLYYQKTIIVPSKTCIYIYNNELYMAVDENEKVVLRKVVIPNG